MLSSYIVYHLPAGDILRRTFPPWMAELPMSEGPGRVPLLQVGPGSRPWRHLGHAQQLSESSHAHVDTEWQPRWSPDSYSQRLKLSLPVRPIHFLLLLCFFTLVFTFY